VGLKSLKSLNLTNGYPNNTNKNNKNNNKVKGKPLELRSRVKKRVVEVIVTTTQQQMTSVTWTIRWQRITSCVHSVEKRKKLGRRIYYSHNGPPKPHFRCVNKCLMSFFVKIEINFKSPNMIRPCATSSKKNTTILQLLPYKLPLDPYLYLLFNLKSGIESSGS
jgi:hypothetical protein